MKVECLASILVLSLTACGGNGKPGGPDLATVKARDETPGRPAASAAAESTDDLILIEPIKATKTTVIENGAPVEKYWASLSEEQRRSLLDLTETIIQVEKRDAGGSITHAAGGITLDKGSYRVSFTYMRFINVPCLPNDPGAGIVREGIALEAAVEMKSSKSGLNIGSIIPIIIAAENKKLSGNIQVRTVGMTTSSAVLSGYLGQNLQLTTESLARAMESLAVVKAVLEQNETTTSPNYLAFREVKPGACSGYIPRGSRAIGGGKIVA